MAFNKFSRSAVAVMFEIAVCCFAADIWHLQEEQQDDTSSIEKRSLKSGVGYPNFAIKRLSLGNVRYQYLFVISGFRNQLKFPAWYERFYLKWKTSVWWTTNQYVIIVTALCANNEIKLINHGSFIYLLIPKVR